MKTTRIPNRFLVVIIVALAFTTAARAQTGETINTRIGKLSFTHDFANGYPTRETVEKLFDERDFQRATQLYLWALPMVSVGEAEAVMMSVPGADKESNWLPAPNDLIYLVMRLYWPRTDAPSVLPPGEGTWKPPGIVKVN